MPIRILQINLRYLEPQQQKSESYLFSDRENARQHRRYMEPYSRNFSGKTLWPADKKGCKFCF